MKITTKKLRCVLQINLPAFCFQALILEKPFRKIFSFFIKLFKHYHQALCLIDQLNLLGFSL